MTMLKQLISTVSDAKEDFAAYGEVLVDLSVDNEAWGNVPLVDHAVRLLRIRDVYQKNKLKRNYAAFVQAASRMDFAETQSLLGKFRSNESLSEEVAETIFDVIVGAQKPVKAEVLGNFAVALARGDLTLDDYNTLALMVHSCSVSALLALPEFLNNNGGKLHCSRPGPVADEGLLFSLGVGTRHGNMFRIDERGRQLAQHGFNCKIVA